MAEVIKRKLDPGFSRNFKVIAVIVVVVIGAAAAVILSAKNKQADLAATNLPPTMNAKGGKPSPETQKYADSLNQANQEGLARAERNNGTFVPAFSDRNAQIDAALRARSQQQAQQQQQQNRSAGQQGGQAAAAQPQPLQPSADVAQMVNQLKQQWSSYPSQEVLGIQKAQEALASNAAKASEAKSTAAAGASTSKTILIHSNDKFYGHMENEIKTDAPSDSLVMLDQGPCKGGELRGTGKLTGEEVTASYTVLTCNGKQYSVQAVALNPDTLSNALPADLDHHVIAHVVVPAILGAVGAGGQAFQNAGATVSSNALGGATVVQSPNPSGKQIFGAAAAGGANGMTQVIQKENDAIPAVTGTVQANQVVIVLFKGDVTEQ